jgi:hypothetical protein
MQFPPLGTSNPIAKRIWIEKEFDGSLAKDRSRGMSGSLSLDALSSSKGQYESFAKALGVNQKQKEIGTE